MTKTALITGASSGFGAAMAQRFAAAGWRLLLVARRQEKLQQLQQSLGDCDVHLLVLDVRCRQTVQLQLSSLPEAFQNIDVLVNNAGLALGLEPAHEVDLDDWDTMVDTNIKGLMYVTHTLLPGMVARNCGHIINIGSVAGNWPYPGGNVYGGSKAFVQQFSRNLRTDLQGTRLRVTNLEPGMAETEFSQVRFKGDTAKAAQVYEDSQPLSGDDIADIVWWVATQPAHVNINTLEVMPVCQSWERLHVEKGLDLGE